MTIQQNRHFLLFSIWLLSISLLATILVACGASSDTATITDFYISPEPIVGRVVTVHIETVSKIDTDEASILVEFPSTVKLVSGSTTWHGSVMAGQLYEHELMICVLEPGILTLYAAFGVEVSPGIEEAEAEFLYVDSQVDSARFLSEQEYFGPDTGASLEATRPIPEVLPECR